MPASHIGALVLVLAVLFLIQLCTTVPGKALEAGSMPASLTPNPPCGILRCSSRLQAGPNLVLTAIWQGNSRCKISLCPPRSLTSSLSLCVCCSASQINQKIFLERGNLTLEICIAQGPKAKISFSRSPLYHMETNLCYFTFCAWFSPSIKWKDDN